MIDRRLYTDSFERLLREKSDEFRMYPVKRIWHSIYNNIHPDRRWPSVSMIILLISSLPFIGYLNSNKELVSFSAKNIGSKPAINGTSYTFLKPADKWKYDNSNSTPIKTTTYISLQKSKSFLPFVKSPSIHQHPLNTVQPVLLSTALFPNKPDLVLNNKTTSYNNLSDENVKQSVPRGMDKKITHESQKAFFESYFENGTLPKKWTDKLALQVYATPGFSENEDANANQNLSVGLEAGTAMQYALSDILKVKAGLQFNYASYNMAALQNDHTMQNTMAVSDPSASFNESRSYSDGIAPVTLHNETYQFSLPVGVELKLLRNNNFQWNAGATIQPTFIAGGNAYLLSADDHSYVDESGLLNRWNLNAGLEVFITYKVKDITWQFGPQFRYQFLSTYGKGITPVDERLATYGVKIGISKLLH